MVDSNVNADIHANGGRGNDVMIGGNGDDVLKGGDGSDIIAGRGGNRRSWAVGNGMRMRCATSFAIMPWRHWPILTPCW